MTHNEKAGVAAFVVVRQIRFDLRALQLQIEDMSRGQQSFFVEACASLEAAIVELEASCIGEEDLRCRSRKKAPNN